MNLPEYLNYRISFAQTKKWKSFLKKFGFVVLSKYISSQQADKAFQELKILIKTLSNQKLNHLNESWKDPNNYPPFLRGGMYHYIAHSKLQWKLRKSAKPIFEELWSTKRLKSSFDGFCIMNGNFNYEIKQLNNDLHVDQHPSNNQLWSYQGIQTLTDALQDGGGFICVPESNHFYKQYFKSKDLANHKGSYNVPENDREIENLKNCIKINTKAGDFILFDSRTFHGNTLPKAKIFRAVTYICMIPQSHISEETLQLRKKAFSDRKNSTHYPGNGFRIFPELPKNCPQQKSETLLKLIRQLNSSQNLEEDPQIMDLV